MAKIYNQKINLALNEELIDKIQDAELKKIFFPYQSNVTKQDIIRALIEYSYNSIKDLKNNE